MSGPSRVGAIVHAGIITIGPSVCITVDTTRVFSIEVLVVAIEALRPVAIGAVRVVAIGPQRRLAVIFVAIGIRVVSEFAHDAAEIPGVRRAGGLHLVQDLAKSHSGLPHRGDLVAAHRNLVVPSDLGGGERAGIRSLAGGEVREHGRMGVRGGIPVAGGFALGPCDRCHQQTDKRPVDDCATHRYLLWISLACSSGDRARRLLRR
jgi:hypothetical protein